jgi:hypothetical protein
MRWRYGVDSCPQKQEIPTGSGSGFSYLEGEPGGVLLVGELNISDWFKVRCAKMHISE